MPKPLTQADLAKLTCQEPGCTCGGETMVFHGQCHKDRATWTRYESKLGVLVITCAFCKSEIVRIKVAER